MIKQFRKQHKLTQAAAAKLLGYKLRTWQEYEQGRTRMPDSLVQHMKHYNELTKI